MPLKEESIKPNITGIIPARYASSRFPGKPLALINGVPMVLRVWEKALESLKDVYIATDHEEIFEVAKKAGAKVLMTSSQHVSGTERVAEAASRIFAGKNAVNEIIINIQGDEPLISSGAINGLCKAFLNEEVKIATLIHKVIDQESKDNPNRPKVVIDRENKAMYFSRAPIPWTATSPGSKTINPVYLHVGIYAYRFMYLQEIVTLPATPLEQVESLEQLRWMEHGYPIHCVETDYTGFGIDVPEDLVILNSSLQGV